MDDFTIDELEAHLTTRTLGRQAALHAALGSTNAEARRLAEAGCPGGAVVIAQTQTAGRGRRGRRWGSEPVCGLWMTFVAEPFMAPEEMQQLTLAVGLAVCRAVARCAGAGPVIKWPNDVLVDGRKLCGILCESAVDASGRRYAVAGVGVNTRAPSAGWGEAAGQAVSLMEATGRAVPRLRLAAEILNETERLLDAWRAEGFAPVAAGYREYMLPAGAKVAVVDAAGTRRGSVEGLDDGGGLLVRLDSGELERIISGEISVLGG
jgi:BirA family biotin operon repressor/biotin-[acetyl-CoA-carboxylase] ligase